MTGASSEIADTAVPRLPKGVRFAYNEPRRRWLLLAPERVLEPDEIGVEILKRCNGSDSVATIVAALAAAFEADAAEVGRDVRGFLADLARKRVLEL
jgi:pyrroloquinoline quinone biosynthesis protein D